MGGHLPIVSLFSISKAVSATCRTWHYKRTVAIMRACSSVGRALRSQCRGREFESHQVHQPFCFPLLILILSLLPISGCSSVKNYLWETEPVQKEAPAMKTRVVVVHGLFRTHRAMYPLRKPLTSAGYEVIEYRYPTTQEKVEEHAKTLREYLLGIVAEDPESPVHLVGHSLGAVISVIATTPPIPGIDRVVQIAPPNLGSPVAEKFEGLFGRFIIPLKELSANTGGPLMGLEPGTETGVIAAKNDQLVPVRCTALKGSKDHISLSGTHTYVLWRNQAHQEVLHFLKHGQFSESAERVELDQDS